jgi:hypothetical protein
MNREFLTVLILLAFACSCKFKDKPVSLKTTAVTQKDGGRKFLNDSLTSALDLNKQFLKDSLIKDEIGLIDYYFSVYQPDTCGVVVHKNSELKEAFEGIRTIKGIKTNKQNDTVFVMPTFNHCDDGESYCFYDSSLPRLSTDSYCCQPDNLFVVEDIDEDGICEIGIYYSSCVSRYKSLRIFSLKHNKWKEIGSSTFDILTQDPSKVKFEKLVKKQAKNKFMVCNFIEGKTEWESITL